MKQEYGFWKRTLRSLTWRFGFQAHKWKVIYEGTFNGITPIEPFVLTHIFVHLLSRYVILIQTMDVLNLLPKKFPIIHIVNNVLMQRIHSELQKNTQTPKIFIGWRTPLISTNQGAIYLYHNSPLPHIL